MRRQLSFAVPRQPRQTGRCLLTLLLVAAIAAPLQAAPADPDAPDAVTIYKVHISGVRDTNFTVSWITDVATDGTVDWGSTTALGTTTADAVTSTRTHYVTIPPEPDKLTASTTYYFRVRSGGATDDNMSDLYVVTTGPLLNPSSAGRIVWGYVYQSGGTVPAADVTVYLQLQDVNGSGNSGASQWVATRTDSSGVWYYSLNSIRTSTAAAYFTFTDGADTLHLIARGSNLGAAELSMTLPSSAAYPAQVADLVLTTPAAPPSPAPSATLVSGTTNFQLTWTHQSHDTDYEVWRSAQPYFLPKQPGTHRRSDQTAPYPGTSLTFTENGVAGNPSANWYYVVRGYDLGGQVAADSTAKGVFSFALAPGSQ